eukprot:gb/GECG01013932.1/.p1 GENE.gb/GECG01013932.1/~~gb/GECG01013932.1/.p1  ORF type:complete len:300 (+),score=33.30 gb/GECG01013932.1/:1-900(+)
MEFLINTTKRLPPTLREPLQAADAWLSRTLSPYIQSSATPDGTLRTEGIAIAILIAVMGTLMMVLIVQHMVGMPAEHTQRGSKRGSRGPASKKNTALILGNSGSGKTALVVHLLRGKQTETVTSMQELIEEGEVSDEGQEAKVKLTDYPGHPRLRGGMHKYLPQASKIILLVDASGASADFRDSAEMIYDLFTDNGFSDLAPPLLICGSKSDLGGARSPKQIQQALEGHLNTIKDSREAISKTAGEDDTMQERTYLCGYGEKFNFKDHSPCMVYFGCCSTYGSADTRDVRQFLINGSLS